MDVLIPHNLVIDEKGDANLALVRSGMRWWYRKYACEQTPVDRVLYEEAEMKAGQEKARLWRDPDPVSPWEWRKRR